MTVRDPASALALWRDALVRGLRLPGPDLSARQLAVLTTVYTRPPPHTVVSLARAFGVPHQALSRAVATLDRLELVKRTPSGDDHRVVLLGRTVKGAVYLRDLGDLIVQADTGAG